MRHIYQKLHLVAFFEEIMDMTLDEMIDCEPEDIPYECHTPKYLKEFYSDTTLSDKWLNLSNTEKENILNTELDNYINHNNFTDDEIIDLYIKYGNPKFPAEKYCLGCLNCKEYSFPCLNCAKFVFGYNLGCGNPEESFDIETPLDVFKMHKSSKEIKDMVGKQA